MRREHRIGILPDGRLEIVDPGYDSLPLLKAVDPEFVIQSAELRGFSSPGRLVAAGRRVPLTAHDLARMPSERLWAAHDSAMQEGDHGPVDGVSLLSLKVALARRSLADCLLCARLCHVNRLEGGRGACGLAQDARYYESFLHVAEEAPINPSCVISLTGCALRCTGCQQGPALNPVNGTDLQLLSAAELDLADARSISFVGGNPSESLPSVLAWLEQQHAALPALPLVWNTHGYDAPTALALLHGIADVYLPDFKFWDEECARQYLHADHYPSTALGAVRRMCEQHVPVFVRILVVPGHVECCHVPTLHALASLNLPTLTVSIRSQYSPQWRVPAGSALDRRASRSEVQRVIQEAVRLGLPTLC